MINQQDLPAYIGTSIPELSGLCDKGNCKNVYDIVREMLKYTAYQLGRHNTKAAKQCLTTVAKLYTKGNAVIKNAIENVYVYSFSQAFFHDDKKREEMLAIVPAKLYNIYKKQVINSHI